MCFGVRFNPKFTLRHRCRPQDAYGGDVMAGLKLVNHTNGAVSDLPVAGLFYGIGHQPNSGLVAGQVELDAQGYVKVSTQGRSRCGTAQMLPCLTCCCGLVAVVHWSSPVGRGEAHPAVSCRIARCEHR